MNEIMNLIPNSCWTILFVAIAGFILLIGVRIIRSKKTNIDVHVGPVEAHIDTERATPKPEQNIGDIPTKFKKELEEAAQKALEVGEKDRAAMLKWQSEQLETGNGNEKV